MLEANNNATKAKRPVSTNMPSDPYLFHKQVSKVAMRGYTLFSENSRFPVWQVPRVGEVSPLELSWVAHSRCVPHHHG